MSPDDLVRVVYLLANKIAPAHEGLELRIGDASIIEALAKACGCKEAQIKMKVMTILYVDLFCLSLRCNCTIFFTLRNAGSTKQK